LVCHDHFLITDWHSKDPWFMSVSFWASSLACSVHSRACEVHNYHSPLRDSSPVEAALCGTEIIRAWSTAFCKYLKFIRELYFIQEQTLYLKEKIGQVVFVSA